VQDLVNIKRALLKVKSAINVRLPSEANIEKLINGKTADAKVCGQFRVLPLVGCCAWMLLPVLCLCVGRGT
jgi:hypothetical protein